MEHLIYLYTETKKKLKLPSLEIVVTQTILRTTSIGIPLKLIFYMIFIAENK